MITVDRVERIFFDFNGLFSPQITVEWKEGKLHYRYSQFGSHIKRYPQRDYEKTIEVSAQEILDFLVDCDRARVRDWHGKRYDDDDIFDASGWALQIEVFLDEDGTTTLYEVETGGYAKFPETFDEFIQGLERLVHESIFSEFYNAEKLREFMEGRFESGENAKTNLTRISAMVLEMIEGKISLEVLDYDFREIFEKYFNLLDTFNYDETDLRIMRHIVWACEGDRDQTAIDLLSHIAPDRREQYVHFCRDRLARNGLWNLDKNTQAKINTLFFDTKLRLFYSKEYSYCKFGRYDTVAYAKKLVEVATNLKNYVNEQRISKRPHSPKDKEILVSDLKIFLAHIEKETKKIVDMIACIQKPGDHIQNLQIQSFLSVIAQQIYDEIAHFIDRLYLIFNGADISRHTLSFRDEQMAQMIESLRDKYDFSDFVPLLELYLEE
ncbi:hypothetical protein [Nitratifractor sp.]